jgi:hypothetical protein
MLQRQKDDVAAITRASRKVHTRLQSSYELEHKLHDECRIRPPERCQCDVDSKRRALAFLGAQGPFELKCRTPTLSHIACISSLWAVPSGGVTTCYGSAYLTVRQ